MTKQVRADLMLVLVTLFWGISYLFINFALKEVDVLTLNAMRFLLAFVVAGVFAFPKLKSVNRVTIKYSAILGVALFFTYVGATYGVKYTSLSNAGFLCALAVVFTPLFAFLFQKKAPDKKLFLAIVVCLIGIGLLTLNEALRPAVGDLFCIMAAVAYAADLLITEAALGKEGVDAFQLGVFQLLFTGLYNLIAALFLETPTLPQTAGVWYVVLFLSIFCTGVAFIVQVLAQQYTSASHVGVIFSLEPVFAGIAAFAFAGEVLTGRGYVGAVLLISSIFIMELDTKALVGSLRKKLKKSQHDSLD